MWSDKEWVEWVKLGLDLRVWNRNKKNWWSEPKWGFICRSTHCGADWRAHRFLDSLRNGYTGPLVDAKGIECSSAHVSKSVIATFAFCTSNCTRRWLTLRAYCPIRANNDHIGHKRPSTVASYVVAQGPFKPNLRRTNEEVLKRHPKRLALLRVGKLLKYQNSQWAIQIKIG